MNPIGICLNKTVSLLKEDNIRHDPRTRTAEGIVGQTDSTEKIGSLRNILSHIGIFFIKRSAACNKRNHTAGTNFIYGFRKEIVMNKKVIFIIFFIKHLKLLKRHIADCHVKKAVGKLCVLISVNRNAVFLIKLTCDSSRKAVKLNTVHLGIHTLGYKTHKIADTARGFKNIATLESHILKRPIHRLDDNRRRIKSRQGRFLGGCIFFGSQQADKLVMLHVPMIFVFIKGIGKTAPSGILCKNFLFFGCCQTILRFKVMQKGDGGNILSELLLRSAHSDFIVGNTVIVLLAVGNFGVELIHGKRFSRFFGFCQFGHWYTLLIVNRNKCLHDFNGRFSVLNSPDFSAVLLGKCNNGF